MHGLLKPETGSVQCTAFSALINPVGLSFGTQKREFVERHDRLDRPALQGSLVQLGLPGQPGRRGLLGLQPRLVDGLPCRFTLGAVSKAARDNWIITCWFKTLYAAR